VHRGLLQAGAWLLATAVAVTLSWFGVHSVLRSTAYDPPRAMAITDTSLPPVASSTHRPKPTTSPPPPVITTTTPTRPTTPPPSSVPVPPVTPPGTPKPTPSVSSQSGDVHGYTVSGGRVVLSLTASAASLVSATPDADWKMQVWNQTGWLRVTFTSADNTHTSSVFCTWNGHPPAVQTFDQQTP
jgi:hypothetical protein